MRTKPLMCLFAGDSVYPRYGLGKAPHPDPLPASGRGRRSAASSRQVLSRLLVGWARLLQVSLLDARRRTILPTRIGQQSEEVGTALTRLYPPLLRVIQRPSVLHHRAAG